VLDFPGAQNLSASDLVKASSMFFQIVNEKFSYKNSALADASSRFLQEIWNEAQVTGRKDAESLNEIAYRHLYGEGGKAKPAPRSEAAKTLLENGLALISKDENLFSSDFNDKLSKIAIFRDSEYTKWEGQTHPLLIVFAHYALEGADLTNIRPSYDPLKGNFLSFEIRGSKKNPSGQSSSPREILYSWTSRFAQEKITGTGLDQYSHGSGWRMAIILNDSVISAPPLKSALKDSAMIEGSFTQREINQLTSDLKAGSLTFTPHILSEKNVSPELGKAERMQGIIATILALLAVIVTMVAYYRFSGVVASVAVLVNLLIMWATLQNIQATLSLAGIAGIILTVGMAVDANVLVFERIREEFAVTSKIAPSIATGYSKAFSAIFDSNITTIIAALILLNFDSGPIKGFALTLIIGIASSFFTALFMTRYYFNYWLKNPAHKELKMMQLIKSASFDFLKQAKYAIAISVLIIAVGGTVFYVQRNAILGMDFTGGFALNLELKEQKGADFRALAEKALVAGGASLQDIQVRELNTPHNLRLLLGLSMEQKGKPFYNLPLEVENRGSFAFEKNPRISWVVQSLQKHKLELSPSCQKTLDKSWTSMSGQMSDAMRSNALIGLAIALVAMLIYIAYRFEFKYAAAAFISLVHDILLSLGTIALLNYFKAPIQIDLNTIAAIMTIIGYSLNDTIIIFDRIREELKFKHSLKLKEVINHALNITLSRTTLTSFTTFIVLLVLALFGGATLFGFAMVMIMGVVYGTLSSLFIAAPCMLFFHNLEEKRSQKKRKELQG
jgi:SecD/SecF fusion protein